MNFDATRPSILIVYDDESMRALLERALAGDYTTVSVEDGYEALSVYEADRFAAVICDLRLPGLSGIDVIHRILQTDGLAKIIILTGQGTIESAVEAIQAGGYHYLTKPVDLNQLLVLVGRCVSERRKAEELQVLRNQLVDKGDFQGMVGVSGEMQDIYRTVSKISKSDSAVLILGETGTGKELIARAIHELSGRKNGPFIAINSGAFSESLLESELFGHEKGAFTGAVQRKLGVFERAKSGTLFLDEVQSMSSTLQSRLLRVTQDGVLTRVGGETEIQTDVRILAASNADLEELALAGKFRSDLYYRLSVVDLHLPPLRQRREDIPLLVTHFLRRFCQEKGRLMPTIAPDAYAALRGYKWPGNVRELENLLQQMLLLTEYDQDEIGMEALPDRIRSSTSIDVDNDVLDTPVDTGPFRKARTNWERLYFERLLRETNSNISEAARRSGLSRRHIYSKLKSLGLADPVE